MDLLYGGRVGAFCIVSSDSDFTRLAARLRESEKYVLGLGEQKTPQSFISACNKFSYIDLLYAAAQEPEPDHPAAKPAAGTAKKGPAPKKTEAGRAGSDLQQVKQALIELAEENSEDDGWILSSKLCDLLVRKLPDFDVRNFRFKKFTRFIESLQCFEAKRQAAEGELVHTIYFRVKDSH